MSTNLHIASNAADGLLKREFVYVFNRVVLVKEQSLNTHSNCIIYERNYSIVHNRHTYMQLETDIKNYSKTNFEFRSVTCDN